RAPHGALLPASPQTKKQNCAGKAGARTRLLRVAEITCSAGVVLRGLGSCWASDAFGAAVGATGVAGVWLLGGLNYGGGGIEGDTGRAMGGIGGEAAKYRGWLRVEVAVCEAYARRGRIPAEALTRIRAARVDVDRILDIQRRVKHEMIALLTSL